MNLFDITVINKNSTLIQNVGKLFELSTSETSHCTTIFYEDGEIGHHEDNVVRFEKLNNKPINGTQIYSKEKESLLKIVISQSKDIINNLSWNLKLSDHYCIEPHSLIAPLIHPFADKEHCDSEEYGDCCTVIYYFDIDENIKGGELQIIKDSNIDIDVNPINDNCKIVCLNHDVRHKVKEIYGSGKRNILCIFIAIDL